MRFLIAGLLLFGWMRASRTPSPTLRQWGGASILAILIFVLDYGLLFWAEKRVPSAIAAVMMATIPVFMVISEILILRTQRLKPQLMLALLVGIAGVAVLISHAATFGDAPIDSAGACALIVAAVSWSIASALSRKLELPAAKAMSSAAQMLVGGVLLTLTAGALGEFRAFHIETVTSGAWLALAYLIFAGSILAFTAYVWLIHHESPTRVGTYAYVNPVVAVALGHFLGNEAIGRRVMIGAALVLVSVIVITTTPKEAVRSTAAGKPS
jgi:drug/metabolite transporter (DMT)-like permease